MDSPRRSYEAHVLLVPLSADAIRTERAMAARGLDGVMTVRGVPAPTSPDRGQHLFDTVALGHQGWRAAAGGITVHELVNNADMVVLLASDLAEVPPWLCLTVAEAARDNGSLIAALVVGSRNWDTPRGNAAMAALREAVDMLVVVRGVDLAAPFIDVLRGGARDSATAL